MKGPALEGYDVCRNRITGLLNCEAEVLALLHLSNKEIAQRLNIRIRLVEKRVEFIFHKLGVQTRTAAALRGVALGLVSPLYSLDD